MKHLIRSGASYLVLFGTSFVFIALRHFSNQRNKQAELENREAFERHKRLQDLAQGYRERRQGEEIARARYSQES